MKEINYWTEMERITKERIAELNIAISKAPTGMHMRWMQATLETNYTFNVIAKNMLTKIDERLKREAAREVFIKTQFRANDDI